MASSVSIADIVSRAGDVLGIVAEDQSLGATKTTDLTNAYNEMYSELAGDQIARWSSAANVPNEYVQAMTNLVAWARVNSYPVSEERYKKIILAAGIAGVTAKDRIRNINAKTWSNAIVPGNFW